MKNVAIPDLLVLEVTYKCNFKCPFCYCIWHECPSVVRQELDTAQWKQIIDDAFKAGIRNFEFSGGEALLRQDIFDLLFYTSSLATDVHAALFTNVFLLTEETISLLKKHRIVITTSLQGLKTYGEMTGTTNDAIHLLKLLRFADSIDWPMDVSITITSVNSVEILDMFCEASNNGAARIIIAPVMVEGKVRKAPNLAIPYEKWLELKRKIRSMTSVPTPCIFGDEILCTCREQPPEFSIFQKPMPSLCTAGKSFAVISPSGFYRKCLHSLEETTIPWAP